MEKAELRQWSVCQQSTCSHVSQVQVYFTYNILMKMLKHEATIIFYVYYSLRNVIVFIYNCAGNWLGSCQLIHLSLMCRTIMNALKLLDMIDFEILLIIRIKSYKKINIVACFKKKIIFVEVFPGTWVKQSTAFCGKKFRNQKKSF